MTPDTRKIGGVALVGAGPGDPGLITARGLDRLRAAQVVVYDALANPALLDQAPPHAERVDVGKRAGRHKLTQDQINDLLLDRVRRGRRVVRLKGGDPYLFGRGAEEAAFLGRHGVPCEVVPGVTSGIAAPAMAGIPVTHRGLASTVTFVTGHEDPTKPDTAIDYAALAGLIAAGGTACFYMGARRLAAITDRLTACGLARSTPAAVVQWGTLPQQRTVRGTLTTIAAEVQRTGLGSPAIIVVGAVAGLDEPGLDFFTERPLFGQTVLVTRTRRQASVLREKLEELGAAVIEAPTIELAPPADWDAVDSALRGRERYTVLALTSVNAVNVLADRLDALGLDARALARITMAVVGRSTARALHHRLAIRADLVPPRADGESLAEAAIERFGVPGRLLLLRADIGRAALPQRLRAAGWGVDEVTAYETRLATSLADEALAALRQGRIDWATFTSAATARNLVTLLGDERDLLRGVGLASIGPVTSAALRDLGLDVAAQASAACVDALARCLSVRVAPRQTRS